MKHNENELIFDDSPKDFTFKECMVGQVRAINDNIFREYNMPGEFLPKDLPESMKPYIKKRQLMTWDNSTGMNPLWDQPPFEDVIYMSYGDMLRDAYETGLDYVTETLPALTAKQYNKFIVEKVGEREGELCFRLAMWWHMWKMMNQPDALDYDFTIMRQCDTWYWPFLEHRRVCELFDHTPKHFFLPEDGSEPKIPLEEHPMVWIGCFQNRKYPSTIMSHSTYYVFNRAALKKLQKGFFYLMVEEIDRLYTDIGWTSRGLQKNGDLSHTVFIKNDITVIDTTDETFILQPHNRVVRCGNWGRAERTVEAVDL